MSSYLNIYIKEKENKPVLLCSYSRNSEIYQGVYETVNPAYAGNEEVYTELTCYDIDRIISEIKENISSVEKRISKYKEMNGGNLEIINEVINLEDYSDELKLELGSFNTLLKIVSDAELYKNKILCNID